jgi:hypothetical protein
MRCGVTWVANSVKNLIESKIQEIRALLLAGVSARQIAIQVKTDRLTVHRAAKRYSLEHLIKTAGRPRTKERRIIPEPIAELWPYNTADDALIVMVNRSLPRTLPNEIREEVAQEMLLAVCNVLNQPQKYIREFYRSRPWTRSIETSPVLQNIVG